jgi:predicted DNA-binding mobile mystery protein A
MKIQQKKLRIKQLDKKIVPLTDLSVSFSPSSGWINAIRTALGMSLSQLGKRLGMSPQGVKDMETREAQGSITLQSLQEAANALDMRLVYVLLPRTGSLEKYIEKRARELAREIVLQTDHTMELEDQGLDQSALQDAIEQRTQKFKDTLPRQLWD